MPHQLNATQIQASRAVECPDCLAQPGHMCVTERGLYYQSHAARRAAVGLPAGWTPPTPPHRVIECPTCGAAPAEVCRSASGLPIQSSHRARRLAAISNSTPA